ncbi:MULTISPECIES: hypothetical protein [Lactococcus]|uniref:hypothetical protein n=1 Tax=Lactococcus TaxID=1357 RepID=UPI002435DF8B|nr:hypothetical protein [Lactococcus formosensis]MDG6143757.1 hypothetical protein [Lactococcus formosensis]
MYQDYYIQQYKSFLQELLLSGKLKIEDVSQELRLCGGRSFYVVALRAARERRDVRSYILTCRLQLQDMEASDELTFQEKQRILADIYTALWFGIDYFEGEKIFHEFLEEQKAAYPDAYRDFTA